MSKDWDLKAWQALIFASEEGSLAAAAKRLYMEPSTLTRTISALEATLRVPLIVRGTRPLKLTEKGSLVVERMREIIKLHQDVMNDIRSDSKDIRGTIRLSIPSGHIRHLILPYIHQFMEMYPEVDFVVNTENTASRVQLDQTDIALIAGTPPKKGFVSKYRSTSYFVPLASPEYIAKFGKPEHPSELNNHIGLIYTGITRAKTVTLENNGETQIVRWKRKLVLTDIEAVKEAAINGYGIALDIPTRHSYKEILNGTLVPILGNWRRPKIDCYAITTYENYRIARIQRFMDWYVEQTLEAAQKRKQLLKVKFPELYPNWEEEHL